MKETSVGLILGGGGAKGAYQVGAYRAIREAGLWDQVTAVSGASIGSINGALFLSVDYEESWEAWQKINALDLLRINEDRIEDEEGIISQEATLDLIHCKCDYEKLKKQNIPLYCAVVHAEAKDSIFGEVEYLRADDKDPALFDKIVSGSCALPMFYEPVEIDGEFYRDGGMIDNIPVKPLYDLGYRKFIVVGLSERGRNVIKHFPDAEFLEIFPLHPLGDLFSATLNFSQKFIRFGYKLGYADAVEWIKHYKNPETYTKEQVLSVCEVNYQHLLKEQHQEEIEEEVNAHFDKLKAIMEQYGA